MSYLFTMLSELHVETSEGDARGHMGCHRDSRQEFRLNLPELIVEEYVRHRIGDARWRISEDIRNSPDALAELADLARALEEFVTDDFVGVSEIGIRRRRGVVELYREVAG